MSICRGASHGVATSRTHLPLHHAALRRPRPGAGLCLLRAARLSDRRLRQLDPIAIIDRDAVELPFNDDPEMAPGGHFVCSITVTASAALDQHYLQDLLSGCVRSPLMATDYGTQEFWVCDPFNTL